MTIDGKFHMTVEYHREFLAGMDHSTVTAAAVLFKNVLENSKAGITQSLGQAEDLMLVLEKENRLTLVFAGIDDR